MAYVAWPEFALGEFATVEFAREFSAGEVAFAADGQAATALPSSATASVSFSFAGGASTSIAGQGRSNAQAAITGLATAAERAQPWANGDGVLEGHSAVSGVALAQSSTQADLTGQAATALVGQSKFSAQAVSAGHSVQYFESEANGIFEFAIEGFGDLAGDTQLTALTTASAAGISDVLVDQGFLQRFGFTAAGVGGAIFSVATDPGFDFRSISTTSFGADALAKTTLFALSVPQAAFVGQGLASARGTLSAAASQDLQAQIVVQMRPYLAGSVDVEFQAQQVLLATAQAMGISPVVLQAQVLADARAQVQGSGTASFASAYLQYLNAVLVASGAADASFDYEYRAYVQARLTSQSVAQLTGLAQAVDWAKLSVVGVSTATWNRGREVLPYLDPAFDVVMRPAEDRGAVRGEEDRTAQHPAETRTVEWTR